MVLSVCCNNNRWTWVEQAAQLWLHQNYFQCRDFFLASFVSPEVSSSNTEQFVVSINSCSRAFAWVNCFVQYMNSNCFAVVKQLLTTATTAGRLPAAFLFSVLLLWLLTDLISAPAEEILFVVIRTSNSGDSQTLTYAPTDYRSAVRRAAWYQRCFDPTHEHYSWWIQQVNWFHLFCYGILPGTSVIAGYSCSDRFARQLNIRLSWGMCLLLFAARLLSSAA